MNGVNMYSKFQKREANPKVKKIFYCLQVKDDVKMAIIKNIMCYK